MTFQLPFVLDGYDRELPAGHYELETDEELIEGLSFPAYRRVAAHLYIHPKPGVTEMLAVSSTSLEDAQLRDEIAVKNSVSGESTKAVASPTSNTSPDENLAPSRSRGSSENKRDLLSKAQKDKQMYISPPIVVSAIVVFGLTVTAWFNPPEPVRTDRTVVLSGLTYKQLQSWSSHNTDAGGQPLSVSQHIAQLATDWQKANPSPDVSATSQ